MGCHLGIAAAMYWVSIAVNIDHVWCGNVVDDICSHHWNVKRCKAAAKYCSRQLSKLLCILVIILWVIVTVMRSNYVKVVANIGCTKMW